MCDSFDTPRGMSVLLDLVSKANVYERAASKGVLNIAVLVAVARWVGDMLRVFGLGEGPVREGDLGWGEEAVAGDASGGGDVSVPACRGRADADSCSQREEVVMPYLKALSNFRDAVRALAREGAPHTELLKLADRLRDIDMVDLGVAMEDNESGQAMLKLVPAAQLQAARAEKEAQQAEKAARKAEAAEKARAARIEKLQKGSVPPSELFRTDEYGSWDERGLPLTMKDGEEVAKKRRKNCEKELERQVKLHQEWQAARDAGEI
jgi:cysteinyl-tRNA synthetase